MTSEVILHSMKNKRLHNFSIKANVYQNLLINECTRKNLAKILEEWKNRITEIFLWNVEGLYIVLNNLTCTLFPYKGPNSESCLSVKAASILSSAGSIESRVSRSFIIRLRASCKTTFNYCSSIWLNSLLLQWGYFYLRLNCQDCLVDCLVDYLIATNMNSIQESKKQLINVIFEKPITIFLGAMILSQLF